ncbi:MAG: extracellular solute-binding protein [Hyphomicrobiaceae bacterium]
MGRILVRESRRDRVGGILAAALIIVVGAVSFPAAGLCDPAAPRQHALSLLGAVRHGPDFKHFDWVNPEAPKGGRARLRATGTYDSLNPFAQKGLAAVWSTVIHDTLMAASLDEPATEYGLVAEWVAHAADFSSATFGLRPEARFHDGRPITPDDVVFSLGALKKSNPRYQIYFKNVARAVVAGERMVTFEFDVKGNRELPMIVGSLPVLARHYWEGKDANGEPRDVSRGTSEIPLGSGPYRIKHADMGRSITYERVDDWWARDLPVARGQWNFGEVRFEYFRDSVPAFEAFKAGQLDFWAESSAKSWATAYDFEALRRGLVRRDEWQIDLVTPMQGFAFNIRRPQFRDPRVRRAFNLAFDFEWASKNILFDQYRRVGSYFENSELKATGLPTGRELELLESVRPLVPPEVFTKPYTNPFNRGPEDARRHMGDAARLLAAAGWRQQQGELRNDAGETFTAEFLIVSPEFERIIHPYSTALGRLGIKTSIRIVDSAQYRRRLNTFDFDIVVASFRQSVTPGNEQRDYWGSAAADSEGSRNLIGIKNPAVDQIIETLIFAKDRSELVAASRALDRVLLWNHYLVPQWYVPKERVAMWDMFSGPARMPTHVPATSRFLQVWWHDAAAAAKLAEARRR